MWLKKSLGQNFLKNPEIVRDIVRVANLAVTPRHRRGVTAETVLEVGPGMGVLTRALLDAGANVIAVEKDMRLIPLIQKIFAKEIAEERLLLIRADILKLDIPTLFSNCLPDRQAGKLHISSFKLVANIPYYITGKFLRQIFSQERLPERVVLLLQKEVAERIVGGNPTSLKLRGARESILSISVKVYGAPSIACYVPRENFDPIPKVDSAVLVIENISRDFFPGGETAGKMSEQKFFNLVKRGFASKRKMLGNNIKLPSPLQQKYGKLRAQDLSLEDWKYLTREL